MRWSCQRIEDSSLRQTFTRRENTFRQVVGNLRFPLTFTYHGCHLFSESREDDKALLHPVSSGTWTPPIVLLGKNTKYDHCHVIVLRCVGGEGLRSRHDAFHGFHRWQALTGSCELD